MNEAAIRKKLTRLRASDERHTGRKLTLRADRATVFRDPKTGQPEGPDSPFARKVIKSEKEARAWNP